jgi:hypothetical protein
MVQIDIYNLKGDMVENLNNLEVSIGNHAVIWNARNNPSGLYFVKILINQDIHTQKIMLLK